MVKKKTEERTVNTALVQKVTADQLPIARIELDNPAIGFATYIRSLKQNWRQGTVACKGRSDVAYSNKKPWKQKGTGRARAGSARSPLWRGGGVTFGPQARTRTLAVSKRLKDGVLNNILFEFAGAGKICVLNWVPEHDKPKTAAAYTALKKAGLADKKVALLVTPHDNITGASFGNISRVRVLYFDQPNAYDLATSDYWVFLNRDVEHFKQMVSQWI